MGISYQSKAVKLPVCSSLLIVVIFLGLTGCSKVRNLWDTDDQNWQALTLWVTRDTKYNQVTAGMTRQAVLSLMGAPDRRYRLSQKNVEEWSYEFPKGEGGIVIDFDAKGIVIVKQFGYD